MQIEVRDLSLQVVQTYEKSEYPAKTRWVNETIGFVLTCDTETKFVWVITTDGRIMSLEVLRADALRARRGEVTLVPIGSSLGSMT